MPTTDEFLEDTIITTLKDMGMWSAEAEKLLMMTAAHESGGLKYDVQMGGGPARSYYQIEPNTLQDLYDNYLAYRPELQAKLDKYMPPGNPPLDEALLDVTYATAAARLIYYRKPASIPAVDDEDGLANYWKQYWNTAQGAGTVEQFLDDWERYKPAAYA
ncbi:hypothetical protein [Kordiimonas marina]|uniref:hypothetical protein n=1 Tax=Kordiimonas marina TaxID=2872312 RepID=UPI001FF1E063|nr:hypothetical protein [Kordiimonas marina]MCJ9430169.1 hypothetical protein [Kordiimonas marina]